MSMSVSWTAIVLFVAVALATAPLRAHAYNAGVELCTGDCLSTGRLDADGSASWSAGPAYAGSARHHPITFSSDRYGYLMAGINDEFDMYRFDFLGGDKGEGAWTTLRTPAVNPGPRGFSYGVAIGSMAYMGFGFNNNLYLRDWWSYDMDNHVFIELAPLPDEGAGRYHPAMVSVEVEPGKWAIFVGCGSSAVGNLGDWWKYDVSTNTWEKQDDVPGAPRHHPYFFDAKTSDGKHYAYVAMGHALSSLGYILKDVWRFDPDPATGGWKEMQDFPGEARVAGTQFSFTYSDTGKGTRGYVLSGDGDNHGYMNFGEFWEYNPNTDEWTQLPAHPGDNSLWAPGSFVVGCKAYLTSGYDRRKGLLHNDLYSYPLASCDDSSIDVPTPSPSPTAAAVTAAPTSASAVDDDVKDNNNGASASQPLYVYMLAAAGTALLGYTGLF